MTRLFDLLAWVKANLKQVLLGTLIVVVLSTALAFFFYNRSQREIRASEALSEVPTPISGSQPPLPNQADNYLKVAKEYPGTKAAARALLEAGGVLYVQGKYAESQQQLERLLKEYPDQWRAEATFSLASTLEALGKTNEATAKYEEVRRNATAAVADEAKLNLARLYEQQNRQVEALKMYDELVKAFPYSGLGAEAGMRLEDLTNRIPSLATNLAPILPPKPTMTMMTNQAMSNRMMMMMTNQAMMSNRMAMMTNQAMSNRVITISNPPPRVQTNAAAANLPGAAKPAGAATTPPAPVAPNSPVLPKPSPGTSPAK